MLVLAGCTGGTDPPGPATLSISPPGQLDEPVTVTVRDLPPGERTTVTATATDGNGVRWSATADYGPDGDGRLSLDQAPSAGDYRGADPMGLLGALAPTAPTDDYFRGPPDVELVVRVRDVEVARGTVRRRTPEDAGVTATRFRPARDGVYGTAFQPADTSRPRPAVLMFSGSEGGLNPVLVQQAALLAARGYPTLAIAYFGAPGLPPGLSRVPLEYFARALALLRTRPGVDPRRVYVLGASRGGEAALLLGATYPQLVDGVVAAVPAATVHGAFPADGHSAWTLGGREVPFTTLFAASAEEVPERDAVIPVERIRGPVLLACGEQDQVWPSCGWVDDMTARLSARRFPYPVTARKYADAGHYAMSFPPYAPFTVGLLDRAGGTVAGNHAAAADFRDRLLTLLGS